MSSTPFGEHLKREREMRGISLEEIAAATRIQTRFLEAIEKERWDQLPGGVFNRGFIRSIARYLGMDEDNLVAEYDLGAKSNGNGHPVSVIPARHLPHKWRPAAMAVTLLALLVAGGAFTYARFEANITAAFHQGVAMAEARIDGTPAGRRSASPAAHRAGAFESVHQPSAPDAAPLLLKLEAGRPAMVKVVADGRVVFEGPVKVNDVKEFRARNTFQVTSSESSALLLELNGQTVPPIGTPGQPGSVTLTRSDLSSASGESH